MSSCACYEIYSKSTAISTIIPTENFTPPPACLEGSLSKDLLRKYHYFSVASELFWKEGVIFAVGLGANIFQQNGGQEQHLCSLRSRS